MSTRNFLSAFLILIMAIMACRFTQSADRTPLPLVPANPMTTAPATEIPATDLPSLNPAALQNAEVLLPTSNTKCKLSNGDCRNGDVSAHLGEPIAVGDVNGDGLDELVFIVGENTGGSGTFVALEVAEDNLGEPLVSEALVLGDRQAVNSISIENGLIVLDMRVHGPDDPLCCPSEAATQTYRLTDFSGLILVRQTTQTPNGKERSITIALPASAETVGRSVRVTGSFTIAPFENNLVYMVYDAMGVPVVISSTTVTAAEMGGPGTFDFPFDVPSEVTGNIRIELKDVSAADGFILALDSVEVTVK